jgi:hypothetical protein
MPAHVEISRDNLIRGILAHRTRSNSLEQAIRNYSHQVIDCAQKLLQRPITPNEALVIKNGLRNYCFPILQAALIEKILPVYRRALNCLNKTQLQNIYNLLQRGQNGIILIQVAPNYTQPVYIAPEFCVLDEALKLATEETKQQQNEITSHMQKQMDALTSNPATLYAINLSEKLGVKGKTFDWKND